MTTTSFIFISKVLFSKEMDCLTFIPKYTFEECGSCCKTCRKFYVEIREAAFVFLVRSTFLIDRR